MHNIYFNTGNSGFSSIGIINIITLNSTEFNITNSELSDISNFITCENTNVNINKVEIKNVK